jgi:hypothetical protein
MVIIIMVINDLEPSPVPVNVRVLWPWSCCVSCFFHRMNWPLLNPVLSGTPFCTPFGLGVRVRACLGGGEVFIQPKEADVRNKTVATADRQNSSVN